MTLDESSRQPRTKTPLPGQPCDTRSVPSGISPGWSRALLLAGLVVLAAVPRIGIAWQRPVLCTDGVFFLERAAAFQDGDWVGGIAGLGLNLYPPLLALIGSLLGNLAWAGTLWSLACASLVVLPLFGLVQRLLGRRTATVAAVLYAAHPELIEWSPEIIRDPQFWLLMTTSLYCGWRAVSQERLAWFVAGGLATAAATWTRFEGWLLWIPLTLWIGWVLSRRREVWLRLTGGWALSLAMLPLSTVALNLVCLPHDAPWQWGRFAHLAMVCDWAESQWSHLGRPRQSAAEAMPPAPSTQRPNQERPRLERPGVGSEMARTPRPTGFREMSWGVRHTLWRGVHPVYLVLAAVGWVVACRRSGLGRPVWLGFDLFALAVVAAMGIYLWDRGEINKRYTLPIVLVALPYAALGAVELAAWFTAGLAAAGDRWNQPRSRLRLYPVGHVGGRWGSALVLALACAAVLGLGWSDAWTSTYASRFMKAELGTWLRLEFGPRRSLLASESLERLVGHYAQAQRRSLPDEVVAGQAAEWLVRTSPEVVVLRQDGAWKADYAELEKAAADRYERIAPARLPPNCQGLKVLVRRDLLITTGPEWRHAELPRQNPPRR